MKLKPLLAGVVLAAAASSSFALTTYNFTGGFTTLGPGSVKQLGFGRLDGFGKLDSAEEQAVAALSAVGGFSTPAANGYTPGELPFNYLDNWTFGGIGAGTYQFDTTFTTSSLLALGTVTLGWTSGGTQHFQSITVAPDFKSASALATINVDGCNVGTCVWVNIYGWEDATDPTRGYHATITQVPEPETFALLLAGLAAVGFVTRRRPSA